MSDVRFWLDLILFFFPAVFPQPLRQNQPADITIQAAPIAAFETQQPSRSQFGSLEFRGGLVLTSTNSLFGGISALRIQSDGANFLALSDRGSWLRGRIVYKNNRPAGIVDAVMAPVLDEHGKPSAHFDTESLAVDGGLRYVGLEGINQIAIFNYGKDGLLAHAQWIPVPPEVSNLPSNQGLEALVFVPRKFRLGGCLIAISERGLDAAGNLKSFIIGGPEPGMFAIKRTHNYDISDADCLPNGDLLILERQLSFLSGFSVRIRRIPLATIMPGAIVDGPVIFEAGMNCQIDNLEALSVLRTRSGEVLLTLMSDDNFSPLQRTILLQFVLNK
jgi:hypothetical protein